MPRILFIEPSAEHRQRLGQSLIRCDYSIDVENDFQRALKKLQDNHETYSVVILGWPAHTQPASDELLATLGEVGHTNTAVLVMSDSATPSLLSWVSGRHHTAFQLWDNVDEVNQSIEMLLSFGNLEITEVDQVDLHPIRVLLVDDSPTARVKFRRLLENSGYQTSTAASPEEAIELAKKQQFDIAILDYFMPGLTGDGLCRKLNELPGEHNIMIAILTSSYSDKVINDSLAAGAVECMFKSEANELFLARVAAMSRQVQSTQHIEQERSQLEGILTSVGDGVYGLNTEGIITFVNPAGLHILGYTGSNQLLGQRPAELFHTSYSKRSEQELNPEHLYQRIQNGEDLHTLESTFACADDRMIQVELTAYPLRIKGKQEGAVIAFRDITRRKLLEDELRWQANHDALTHIYNRKYFEDALEQEVRRLKRSDEQSALLYLDLDRFKYVNDTATHLVGDQLLVEVAQQLTKRLRHSDLLARIGGDEFALILRNVQDEDIVSCSKEFLNQLKDTPFYVNERIYNIQASIGVRLIDKDTESPEELLTDADIACQQAKNSGRNQVHLFKPETDNKAAMDLELGWSIRLKNAIDTGAFVLHYQPILPVSNLDENKMHEEAGHVWSSMCGKFIPDDVMYEVLLRLPDSQERNINPGAFLPTAERFNMMPEIDYWVVDNALDYQTRLHSAGINATLTVNLSGQSLDSKNIIELVRRRVAENQLDPSRIVFEITETCAIYNIDSAQHLIKELSALGCRFALDDFGSGYCSFSHLKHLPVEFIKIDGLFIKDVSNDKTDLAIVRSINNIAHSLGMKTVAEWVEDRESLQLLKESGVDYVQGYYLSRPLALVPSSPELLSLDPFASGLNQR